MLFSPTFLSFNKVNIIITFNKFNYEMKDSIRQKQRGQQLEEELKFQQQELENMLTKQKEVGVQRSLMLCLKNAMV